MQELFGKPIVHAVFNPGDTVGLLTLEGCEDPFSRSHFSSFSPIWICPRVQRRWLTSMTIRAASLETDQKRGFKKPVFHLSVPSSSETTISPPNCTFR